MLNASNELSDCITLETKKNVGECKGTRIQLPPTICIEQPQNFNESLHYRKGTLAAKKTQTEVKTTQEEDNVLEFIRISGDRAGRSYKGRA